MRECAQREAEKSFGWRSARSVNINLLNDNTIYIYIFPLQFLSNEMGKK